MNLDRRYGTLLHAILTPARYENPELFGAIYRPDRTLVIEALRTELLAWRPSDPAMLPDSAVPTVHLDEAIYCGRFFRHFGHFLLETLPSLLWGVGTQSALLFHFWRNAGPPFPQHVQFSLAALGINPARITPVEEIITVKRLAVPPTRRIFNPDEFSSPFTAFAFRLVAAAAGAATRSGRRLFFSRHHQKARVHPESDRIDALFAERGFEIVSPETFPFPEQIRMMKEASIVAGLDGSALHLCGFMDKGVCLILQTRGGLLKAFEVVNTSAGVSTIRLDIRPGLHEPAIDDHIRQCEDLLAKQGKNACQG